ncbi:hypothetical protein FRC0475_01103 [Corynebacterium diphtheriae]|nr:hypothetical protein CIP100629_01050 [Corynebacterium diphtheriae]CAB0641247.1 hypothetical protein CIP107565_00857 [Corynebacterium diphtheriae]CAB0644111.1 hypothetical protein CIP107570_00984 [Corynebacterium diphtheriae]CAB0858556.1 hypothetical protein FRC0370_00915 [Corynebacterium diphtheriae]CAB0948137.1 hypothetical protein FRC0463_00911 [Corynebacterium diphtheriae]
MWRPTHTPGPVFAIDPNFKLGNSQDTRPGAAGNKVADRGVPNTGDLRQILKRLQLDVVANVTANVASVKLQTGVRQVLNLSVGPLGVELFGDGLSSGHVTSVSNTRSGATFTRLDVVDLCRYSAKSMVLLRTIDRKDASHVVARFTGPTTDCGVASVTFQHPYLKYAQGGEPQPMSN